MSNKDDYQPAIFRCLGCGWLGNYVDCKKDQLGSPNCPKCGGGLVVLKAG